MTINKRSGACPSQAANATARAYVREREQRQSDSSTQDSTSRPGPGSPPVPPVHFENTTLVEYALHQLRWQRLEEAQLPIFIAPLAKANLQALDEGLFPLKEKVQEFLASERQVMLILGDSGAGKSTFNRYLERQLWTAYQNSDPVLLFINPPSIERPAKELIVEHLRTNHFSEEQIQEMRLYRQFVLICDGYDESQLTVNLHTSNLFNQLGQWKVKMVISCRTQFLGQEYRSRFMPEGFSHYQGHAIDLFQEAVIAPFSKEQIGDYVEQYVPLEQCTWTTKDYMDRLTTIPNLIDLVKNPFLLSLSLEALPGVTEGQQDLSAIKITRVHLYDTFVRHWFAVNSRRLQRNVLTREDRDMLDQLVKAGFISMGVDYATSLASAIFEHQDGNPVVHSLNDRDEFAPQSDNDSTDPALLDAKVPLFKRSLLTEPSVIQFLCEGVKLHPCFEKQLRAVNEQSKTDATTATAAANAITILVRAGVRFNSANFRGIRITGADLSDGQFDSAQFQGVDLTGVNFARSWSRQVDFDDAQMDGVRFEELPYLKEHAAVNAVAFSPDGKLLAVALIDDGLITYDTTTWTQVRQREERREVLSIAFSPNNRHLAIGSNDKTCRLSDTVSSETLLAMKGHTHWVRSVPFSPCGKQIASASDDSTIRLWSSETGECLLVLNGHEDFVLSVAYSADGRRLVSGSRDGTIRVWDPKTGAPEADWVIPYVSAARVTLSPDGRRFAVMTSSSSSEIHLVDAITAETGLILDDDADQIVFSPNGELITSSNWDKTVRLWDSSSGQLISRLSGHLKEIITCTFSPDGLQIASGDWDGIIRLWEVNTNRPSSIIQELTGEVGTVAYSHDVLSIISYHNDKAIQHWNSSTGSSRSIPLPSALEVYSVSLSPNGHWFASGCENGNIRLTNAQTDAVERILLGSTDYPIVDMSFSHCGQWLVSFDRDGVTRLWDLNRPYDQGKVVVEPAGQYSEGGGSVVFSPVGDQIAVGLLSSPPGLCLFDPRVKDLRQPLKEFRLSYRVRSKNYSPDGQRLVLGTDPFSVLIWDLQSDKPDVKLEGHLGPVNCVAYSPCGKWILSGGSDKTVRLWSGEVDSWSCVAFVRGRSEAVTSVAWNPVVPLEFVTGSNDGSVRVWRISSAEAGRVSIRMHWGSSIGQLCVVDLAFKGAVGLSPTCRKLLIQRGASMRI